MKNLFKNLLKNTKCKRNGICSIDPVLNAIDAVIINEIRQIAFYIVKLKELNFTNKEIMKEAVFALSASIIDTDFDKEEFYSFIENLKNIKNKAKNFYAQKAQEMNFSFEFITPPNSTDEDKINYTNLIKSGEIIINKFYTSVDKEKAGLLNLIILAAKITSINLIKLSSVKEVDDNYYFEILRLLYVVNSIGTRKEKLTRRIKEFSKISYEIQSELDFELEKIYVKRKSVQIGTNIYEGKSILVSGNDLDELYNLLKVADNINIYTTPSMIIASTYPKFNEFKNFKGIFGVGDDEFDFSHFTDIGPIFITKNSPNGLDMAVRGKIFTSKLIHSTKAKKIDNLNTVIEAVNEFEGFKKETKGSIVNFNFDLNSVEKILNNAEDKKVLIAIGFVCNAIKEKFKDYILINFEYPNETQGLYFAINKCKKENTSVYFSNCSPASIGIISSLLGQNLSKIYLSDCKAVNINPHIIEALQKDFGIELIHFIP